MGGANSRLVLAKRNAGSIVTPATREAPPRSGHTDQDSIAPTTSLDHRARP
jgi:hypothetical protein